MVDRNERVEALLRAFVVEEYRRDHLSEERPAVPCVEHLPHCPDVAVIEVDAYNSTYGCDTGCDYARLEAVLTCPHGGRAEFEWGEFGEMDSVIDALIAADERGKA